MNIHEKLGKMKGKLSIRVMNRQGEIVNIYEWDNLIVNTGYQAAAEMLATGKQITYVGMGTNSAAPIPEDTALTNPFTVPMTSVDYPEIEGAIASVRFNFSVDFLQAVGMNIHEWGLLTNDMQLFSRLTRAVIIKTNEMMLLGQWVINM